MNTVIMSECVGRPVCVCVFVVSVCRGNQSHSRAISSEPTNELYRPTAAVAERRRDPAEPLLHCMLGTCGGDAKQKRYYSRFEVEEAFTPALSSNNVLLTWSKYVYPSLCVLYLYHLIISSLQFYKRDDRTEKKTQTQYS